MWCVHEMVSPFGECVPFHLQHVKLTIPFLSQELVKLEGILFGSTTTPAQAKTWSWRPLLRQVSRARARHFSFTKKAAAKDAFGSLNPGVEKIF